jgi:aminoglycoside phosphotransferase (APT) family kinase protein
MPTPHIDRTRWQVLAEVLLPGVRVDVRSVVERGGSHEVLILPGVAVIRAALTADAASLMPRRLRLLQRLNELGLPFAVPSPMSDAVVVDGVTASVLSWIPGMPGSSGSHPAAELTRLLTALREVDISALADVLDVPHAYAGRDRWARLLVDEVVPRLPADVQKESMRRIDAALAMPVMPATLVHGDLAGGNLLWHQDGTLSGVVDWDLACAFDPAVDAACLAWFGWPTVAVMVDASTYQRARIWSATFGLEQVSAALLDKKLDSQVDAVAARTAQWIRRTTHPGVN